MNTKEKISEFILGTELSNIGECVVIAPCWSPISVGIKNAEVISDATCKIWNCSIGNVSFSYIVCGVGACLCADIVMALESTQCKRILFLGSAGALSPKMKIGDFVIPEAVISGEGASRYLTGKLFEDLFGKRFEVDEDITRILYEKCSLSAENYGVSCHYGVGISVESIFSQFDFLNQFYGMGCDCIDMESSAFLVSARKCRFDAGICFCISDNVSSGEPLMNIDESKVKFRKAIRHSVLPQVLYYFFE